MLKRHVAIIGGGISGMEAACIMAKSGHEITIFDAGEKLGGHVAKWDLLFPNMRKGEEILATLLDQLPQSIHILSNTIIQNIERGNGGYIIHSALIDNIFADAVLFAGGFDTFDATRKEEYGYGIYDNVITSIELEDKIKEHHFTTSQGTLPKRVAMIHCVGSRDEKVCNNYCSRVCCVTAVKQAIEIKKASPETEVFCFYMDLRMFGRHFEELYREAQEKYGIQFIRGRLSEASENKDKTIIVKAEDTLLGKPLKMTVDLMVLMVGMELSKSIVPLVEKMQLEVGMDRFIMPLDEQLYPNKTKQEGVFVTGTCTGPKNIPETLNDARSAALTIMNYFDQLSNKN
ncbi:MAG: CoB--CoM heterodisulfide reductase iron-sulfur subunit A family protein [Bacteroidetes bacterium]|nr:CoB--CoM heterodisulfide reductase iron-sulfur subunit A family protein [Bacteroidota bacterium]